MASVQSNPDMGQGAMPANITKEQIQRVYQVRTAMAALDVPGAIAYERSLANKLACSNTSR